MEQSINQQLYEQQKIKRKNDHVIKAKKEKDDEFYTRYEDIEKELFFYQHLLKGKSIYLPCDNPEWSNFYLFFKTNFEKLGLKEILTNHLQNPTSYRTITTKDGVEKTESFGNGDFRNDESLAFFDRCDIVITNPPFSLIVDFIKILKEKDKDFLYIANLITLRNKTIISLFKENKIRAGVNSISKFIKNNEEAVVSAVWYTSLNHGIVKPLVKPPEYKKYDNYDAINVDKVDQILFDYEGKQGVPITYLLKHDPEKFDIIEELSPYIDGKKIFARLIIQKKP